MTNDITKNEIEYEYEVIWNTGGYGEDHSETFETLEKAQDEAQRVNAETGVEVSIFRQWWDEEDEHHSEFIEDAETGDETESWQMRFTEAVIEQIECYGVLTDGDGAHGSCYFSAGGFNVRLSDHPSTGSYCGLVATDIYLSYSHLNQYYTEADVKEVARWTVEGVIEKLKSNIS